MNSLHKHFWLLAISFVFVGTIVAQTSHGFVSAEKNENNLTIHTSTGQIIFTPFTQAAFEVEFVPKGEVNPPSYSVAIEPLEMTVDFKESDATIRYSTGDMTVEITKEPLNIEYFYRGKELISENEGYFDHDTLKGFNFNLSPSEKLMGGGSRVLGMDRRGHRLKLYNQASYGYETKAELMYYSMPVVISSKKYMLVFDNGASGFMDLGATQKDVLSFEAVGGRMSYLVIAANGWDELAVNFTELTGRQPMVPRWAMGNIASRMGYRTQEQVEMVVDKYIDDEIPLDAIVLDLYWFGPGLFNHMGNLDWDLDSFPEPEKMMANIKKKGVKTVLITEPFILNTSSKYAEAAEKGIFGLDSTGNPYVYDFYFGTTSLIDIFKPEAREWFWDVYKRHTLTGVDGWWGDLGEPEVHPDDLLHVNGRADEVHNLYGHEWGKMVYDGFAKDFPEHRPVILMRSGFVGSQRYGMVPWSGDVNRTWGGLKPQVELSLQMGMQGLAYMHSDLGGFAGDYEDAELYIRWLQYGVFQPIYRTHAQEEVPAEPIFWDDTTKSIVKDYIELRYKLMPYNYTLLYQNATRGLPMMRPLFYIDDTPALLDEKNTYLWGDNFLVSPVTEKGIKQQAVYLPKNASWFNFWNDEVFRGGQEVTLNLDLGHIPVYVKAGSFVPMAPLFQNMEEYNSDTLTVHYYHDKSVQQSDGFMYDDDGETKEAYLKEQYEMLSFESEYNEKEGLKIEISPEGYDYEGKPEKRQVELVIHGLKEMPKKIKVDGKKLKKGISWDVEYKRVSFLVEVKEEKREVEVR